MNPLPIGFREFLIGQALTGFIANTGGTGPDVAKKAVKAADDVLEVMRGQIPPTGGGPRR